MKKIYKEKHASVWSLFVNLSPIMQSSKKTGNTTTKNRVADPAGDNPDPAEDYPDPEPTPDQKNGSRSEWRVKIRAGTALHENSDPSPKRHGTDSRFKIGSGSEVQE